MTDSRHDEEALIRRAIDFLKSLSSEDAQDWLTRGFRAMAKGDRSSKPFGDVRFAYPRAEDITDVLASAYFDLTSSELAEDGSAFTRGLEATFRGLSPDREEDQRILIDILRLATKISYTRLLPHIAQKLFRDARDPTETSRRLRSVAADAAVELSTQSPRAIASLHDIIASKLFRPSAARSILLALCSAEPDDLFDHLCRLEAPLAATFGDARQPADDAMWRRRSLLLADILRFSSPSVVLGAVELCLQNRTWPLAWLGEIFLDPDRYSTIPSSDAERVAMSFEQFPSHRVIEVQFPVWRKPEELQAPTLHDNRRDTEILQSDDSTPEEEERVSGSIRSRLANSSAQQRFTNAKFRADVMVETRPGEAA